MSSNKKARVEKINDRPEPRHEDPMVVEARYHADAKMMSQIAEMKFVSNRMKPYGETGTGGDKPREHEHMPLTWFVEKARRELDELEKALAEGEMHNAVMEAADVSNYMTFLVGKISRQINMKVDIALTSPFEENF